MPMRVPATVSTALHDPGLPLTTPEPIQAYSRVPFLSVLIVLFFQTARSTPAGSRHSMVRSWPGLAGTFQTKFA